MAYQMTLFLNEICLGAIFVWFLQHTKRLSTWRKSIVYLAQALALAFTVSGCSGGSGQAPVSNVAPDVEDEVQTLPDYKGNDPLGADVRNFQAELWEPLRALDKCGACHVEGNQAPYFVRSDDINAAYETVMSLNLVNLESPGLSRLVERADSGHYCWASTEPPEFCGDVIETYIGNWASVGGVEVNEVVLIPPAELKAVGVSKSFPADTALFQDLYGVMTNENYSCVGCHSEATELKQQPYFASPDIGIAYDALKSKVSLDTPANSRLVYRLRSESHNCWTNSCDADAQVIQDAIQAFADTLVVTEIDPALVVSRMMLLDDGVQASAGGRIENNAIALYKFQPNDQNVALDTSGIEPPAHLDFIGDVDWVGSWGVTINDGRVQGDSDDSKKIHDSLKATGEYAIEAWVVPFNVTQEGPARIVTYSGNAQTRNFMLGQTLYNYNFSSRSSETDANGMPMLSTPDADEALQASLQHVVLNYNPISGRSIYINGELAAQDETAGNLNGWKDDFALAIGSEVDSDYVWRGTVRLLAIHDRTLSAESILSNFESGVGQKIYMLFSVSHLVDIPQAYIVFQAQQFDNYSYLFNNPYFLSLDSSAVIPSDGIRIKGLRIGMNGKEVGNGQSFANIDLTVTPDNYNSEIGTPLSALGAILEIEKGVEEDEFFVSFDQFNDTVYDRPAELPPVPEDIILSDTEQPDIGVRNFAEIQATIAAVTGVDSTTSSVVSVYDVVKQQMPTAEDLDGFLSAHQAGIMQLSVAYCTALVNDTAKRSSYFTGFDFSANYATAFDSTGRSHVISPLMKGLLAHAIDVDGTPTSLDTQPAPSDIENELNNLIDNMASADTQTIVIATCATAVGSAVMLFQ